MAYVTFLYHYTNFKLVLSRAQREATGSHFTLIQKRIFLYTAAVGSDIKEGSITAAIVLVPDKRKHFERMQNRNEIEK